MSARFFFARLLAGRVNVTIVLVLTCCIYPLSR